MFVEGKKILGDISGGHEGCMLVRRKKRVYASSQWKDPRKGVELKIGPKKMVNQQRNIPEEGGEKRLWLL